MQLLKVDDLDTARGKLQKVFGSKLSQQMKISVEDSLGYVVAEDICSEIMIPQFRRSTVDGYAVIAKNTQGASDTIPVFLEMIEEVDIGEIPELELRDGQCTYVPTGGMIPEGADAMVMVEYSEEFMPGEMALYKSVAAGGSVVQVGEDLEVGELVVKRGTQIRGQEIGILCAAGVTEVSVYIPVRIAIISTGNELVGMEEAIVPGKVKDVNTYAIAGLAEELGMVVVNKVLVKDEEIQIREALEQAMDMADVIVISGGSSKGKKDMTERLIDEVSSEGVFTHGLALKPGKPTILGWDNHSESLFLGLPGHPVAAMIVFRLLMEWIQADTRGSSHAYAIPAYMEKNLAGAPGRQTCILVELAYDAQIKCYMAKPILGKSGLISTLSRAYGYVIIEKNTEGVKAGELVSVWPV